MGGAPLGPVVGPNDRDARPPQSAARSRLFAAGNGVGNAFDVPIATYGSDQTGASWNITVGAIRRDNQRAIVGDGIPVDISAWGDGNLPSACRTGTVGQCAFGGTSAATPYTAGVFGTVLTGVRREIGDPFVGQRPGQVVAEGPGRPRLASILADGKLTRTELREAVLKTAFPLNQDNQVSTFPFPLTAPYAGEANVLFEGYGAATPESARRAIDVILGRALLPDRSFEDDFFALDQAVKDTLYGGYDRDGDGDDGLRRARRHDADAGVGGQRRGLDRRAAARRGRRSVRSSARGNGQNALTYYLHRRFVAEPGKPLSCNADDNESYLDTSNTAGDLECFENRVTSVPAAYRPLGIYAQDGVIDAPLPAGSTVFATLYVASETATVGRATGVLMATDREIGTGASAVQPILGFGTGPGSNAQGNPAAGWRRLRGRRRAVLDEVRPVVRDDPAGLHRRAADLPDPAPRRAGLCLRPRGRPRVEVHDRRRADAGRRARLRRDDRRAGRRLDRRLGLARSSPADGSPSPTSGPTRRARATTRPAGRSRSRSTTPASAHRSRRPSTRPAGRGARRSAPCRTVRTRSAPGPGSTDDLERRVRRTSRVRPDARVEWQVVGRNAAPASERLAGRRRRRRLAVRVPHRRLRQGPPDDRRPAGRRRTGSGPVDRDRALPVAHGSGPARSVPEPAPATRSPRQVAANDGITDCAYDGRPPRARGMFDGRPMRLASLLLASVLVVVAAAPATVAAADPPRDGVNVVVIVGPVGDLTDRYLARGEAAAREAERFTTNVTRVFTPGATWPQVRRALQGADLVVYLGHGNGWPSQYRDGLYPPTQNGFGLNPVEGGGHDAHQYFGEGPIAAQVRLGSGAIVLLHHLCYASGNTEPGLPEGTVEEARQRVDNYAAGFIAAGAAAVIAEGHLSPAWYVRSILSGERSVEAIWRAAPSRNGNATTFGSERSPGFVAAVDPDRVDGGYYRSLVVRPGAGSTLTGGGARPAEAGAGVPSLVGTGLHFGQPYLKGRPVAGSAVEAWIPYEDAGGSARQLMVGARWDPLDGEAPTAGEPIALVAPERSGSVVEPVPVKAGKTRLVVPIAMPAERGRYRLVLTLHDESGVAFDAASQALSGLVVRVAGRLDTAWSVVPAFEVVAGSVTDLPLVLANVGAERWARPAADGAVRRRGFVRPGATVVGHWLALDPDAESPPVRVRVDLRDGLEPGASVTAILGVVAPARPGDYLLVLDVVVPGHGSLAAKGVDPQLVRVTVQ